MRHGKGTAKLGMKSQHRRATLANMVCSLIIHNQIRTTVAKAKEARRWADRMVTLAKKGDLHHRRRAQSFLRQKPAVKKLFAEIGPQFVDRNGGYTRVVRLGNRIGDAAEMALLGWTGSVAVSPEPDQGKEEQTKGKRTKKKAKSP